MVTIASASPADPSSRPSSETEISPAGVLSRGAGGIVQQIAAMLARKLGRAAPCRLSFIHRSPRTLCAAGCTASLPRRPGSPPQAAACLRRFEELGPTVIIGGMLRNLRLRPIAAFTSDIDCVVDPVSLPEFTKVMQSWGAVRNRFGGYALALPHGQIEVWSLPETWAHRAVHVEVGRLEDLLRATFFDWDAILYEPRTQKLFGADLHLARLQSGVIDTNLAATPSPLGNAIRALRHAMMFGQAQPAPCRLRGAADQRARLGDAFGARAKSVFGAALRPPGAREVAAPAGGVAR